MFALELKDYRDETLSDGRHVVVLASLQLLLSVIIFAGNGIAMMVVLKDPNKNLRTASMVFVVNLAIADLLLGFVVGPIYSIFLLTLMPEQYVDNLTSVLAFGVVASSFTLAALGIQRWIVVEMPLRAKKILTRKRLGITIVVIWLVAGVLAFRLPRMVLKHFNVHIKKIYYDVVIYNDVMGSILPILVVSVYGRIWVLVRRSKNIREELSAPSVTEKQPLVKKNHTEAIRKERVREAKVTQTFFIVCGAFIICWLPAHLYMLITGTDDTLAFDYCLLVGLTNSALNPLIYSFTNVRFKQALKKIIAGKNNG